MEQLKIYLASGWFSDDQMALCTSLEDCLDNLGYNTFKPRVESKITSANPTMEERKVTFKGNVSNIDDCDIMVANVTYKDTGVHFEIGYAFAKNKPIIFFKQDNDARPFNLMLAQASDFAPAATLEELEARLNDFKSGTISAYEGEIE